MQPAPNIVFGCLADAGVECSCWWMDRTTLTANLRPLERHGLLKVSVDPDDRRRRALALTPAGRKLLGVAVPVWKRTHAEIERKIGASDPDRLRADLRALA